MKIANGLKLGTGTFLVLMGLYLVFNFKDIISILVGIFSIALGIGIISTI